MAYQEPVVVEKIKVLSTNNYGGTCELNRVSVDGAPAKLDVRQYYNDKKGVRHAGRGIQLNDDEAFALMNALRDCF